MKKLFAILFAVAFLFSMPALTSADEGDWMSDMEHSTEEFGTNFFTYAHDLVLFPLDVTEKAVRTLLMMDHQ